MRLLVDEIKKVNDKTFSLNQPLNQLDKESFEFGQKMFDGCKTIIVANELLDELSNEIDKCDAPTNLYLPFNKIAFQWRHPIKTKYAHTNLVTCIQEDDYVLGAIFGLDNNDLRYRNMFCISLDHGRKKFFRWHQERVNLLPSGKKLQLNDSIIHAYEADYYRRLIIVLTNLINSTNVEVVLNKKDKKINNRRAKKGKRILPDYYFINIDGKRYQSTPSGIKGSTRRLHQVRGHFRILPSTKRTWVRPHWRGIKREGKQPQAVYKLTTTAAP